eukprot:TRINITY_DN82303_c0_g1_i1.p1 TRINITY_DN82303_c0_g1~~TRINITY_DN82303_c0_g1_i1.p1  ORF type:complete len:659 (+),score=180.15 TRINITY_DN82303_c0_g1_i1:97-1977(+)
MNRVRVYVLLFLFLIVSQTSLFHAATDEEASSSESSSSETSGNPLCEADEADEAKDMLILFIIVFVSIVIGYILLKTHFHYLPESCATIIVGIIVGLVFRLLGHHLTDVVRMNAEFFFVFLLPAIIFEAGYSLDRADFLNNIGGICTFAVFGTIISCFVTVILLYVAASMGLSDSMPFVDYMLFSALISAIDPVATLAIFCSQNVNPTLHMLVFGESVVNDAVAIVLFRTFEYFVDHPINFVNSMRGVGTFFILFVGSVILGLIGSLLPALMYKKTRLRNFPILELSTLLLLAYVPYLIAEMVKLSGIMCILTTGVVMAYYVKPNLSVVNQSMSSDVFRVLAFISETLVFAYLGLAVFAFDHKIHIGIVIVTLIGCLLGRFCNIYPLSALLNRFRENKITNKNRFVMFFSGLRGAIAFALAIDLLRPDSPVKDGELLFSTTLVVVLITVFGFGGGTLPLLRALKVEGRPTTTKMDVYQKIPNSRAYWDIMLEERKKQHDNLLVRLDEKFLRRWFCRQDAFPTTTAEEDARIKEMVEVWHHHDEDMVDLGHQHETELLEEQSVLLEDGYDDGYAEGQEEGVQRGEEVMDILHTLLEDPTRVTHTREALRLLEKMKGVSSSSRLTHGR